MITSRGGSEANYVDLVASSEEFERHHYGGKSEFSNALQWMYGDVRTELGSAFGRPSIVGVSDDRFLVILTRPITRLIAFDLQSWRMVCAISGLSDPGEAVGVAMQTDTNHITQINNDGAIHVYSCNSGDEVLSGAFDGGKSVIMDRNGYFRGSEKAPSYLRIAIPGLTGRQSLLQLNSQFYQALYRPDLIDEALKGDPEGKVRAAAAKLDFSSVIQSGSPPRVAFDGQPTAEAADNQRTVALTLEDQGGGVGRIEWRVNGTTAGITDGAPAARINRTLALQPGENHISVVAYNRANLIASDPIETVVTVAAAAAAGRQPELHVLAVGISGYWDSSLNLKFAVPDVSGVADTLRRAGQPIFRAVHITPVLDKDATRAGLEATFQKMAAEIDAQDVFVLMVAGHGKTVDGRYYFIPYDLHFSGEESIVEQGIGQDQWQKWLAMIPANKSVLLFDTCESGSLTAELFQRRGVERMTAIDKLTRATGRTTIAAAAADQAAIEGYQGHGLFSWVVLNTFAATQPAEDRLVRLTDLVQRVTDQVPELSARVFGESARQVPQILMQGNDFPLGKVIPASTASAGPTTAQPRQPAQADAAPRRPTHVAIAAIQAHDQPNAQATVTGSLEPGMQVTVLEQAPDGTWVLVERDGRRIGYVAADQLLPLQ